MTERKPGGLSWESWIDRQISEARARGEFDDLPLHGKPIPGIGEQWDELWWIKDKLRREEISYLPPAIAIRKEAEEALAAIDEAVDERRVRAILADINERIVKLNRTTISGPPTTLMRFDVEAVVARWRERSGGEQL